jgi:hypothetical protein
MRVSQKGVRDPRDIFWQFISLNEILIECVVNQYEVVFCGE